MCAAQQPPSTHTDVAAACCSSASRAVDQVQGAERFLNAATHASALRAAVGGCRKGWMILVGGMKHLLSGRPVDEPGRTRWSWHPRGPARCAQTPRLPAASLGRSPSTAPVWQPSRHVSAPRDLWRSCCEYVHRAACCRSAEIVRCVTQQSAPSLCARSWQPGFCLPPHGSRSHLQHDSRTMFGRRDCAGSIRFAALALIFSMVKTVTQHEKQPAASGHLGLARRQPSPALSKQPRAQLGLSPVSPAS